ncbi:MAG: hypothetical protein IJC25_01675 [Clostridia bacterium]|nr:hypothetical protein [Clostridia bacterium]
MREVLTSRQRVLNAIGHKPLDRYPIDLSVHFSTGISAFAYRDLREYLGLDTDHIEMADCVQLLARVDDDICERFHVDTLLLNPRWTDTHVWNPRGSYRFHVPQNFRPVQNADGSWRFSRDGQTMYMPAGGYFFDGAWPDFFPEDEEEKLNLFARRAEYIAKETDKFTLMMGYSAFFEGLDQACEMLLDPQACLEANERALQRQIARFDRMNRRMGGWINAIEVNSDLGSQQGLLCTPQSYEQICYPFLKRFCEHVHRNSDIKVFLHSCGAISEALPYIVDAGVDVLNPVQIAARGMDAAELKQKYGDKLCFWGGGCDTQTALWSYTPQQVRAHVIAMTDIFKQNGGFVFNQVHNILGNVAPQNIVAMLDAAYENSWYGSDE